MSAAVRTVFGSMEIARRACLQESRKMLDLFSDFGGKEVDTAFMYGGGETEKYLGKLNGNVDDAFMYATKANPWEGKGLGSKSVRSQLETSLKNLQRDDVEIFYLHAPDHETPLIETLKVVDELYKEGKFKELGLSNYSSWLVSEVYNACQQNNWVKPTVYQGMYSALTRMVEKELFPCLRSYNIRFYAFSPLAGGFLTGKHKFEKLFDDKQGRFFGSGQSVDLYRGRYWKQEYFDAVKAIQSSIISTYGPTSISIAEASFRWLYHHSSLEAQHGDAVIVGASTAKQLEENLSYTDQGPLDENVVQVIDGVWQNTAHVCPDYAR